MKPRNLSNRNLALSMLALCLYISTGCQIAQPGRLKAANGHCDAEVQACLAVPRELDKATVPMYRVEPPDVLSIDVAQPQSHTSYALQVGDVVGMMVQGTFPDAPIAGEYCIDAAGGVDLGYGYGSVEIAGQTIAKATQLVEVHLREQLRDPQVLISRRNVAEVQRISGEHMVGPDGTVTLGQYGSVPVVGLTLDEVRMTIAAHLSQTIDQPQVSVSVFAYNSKAYYIITQGGGLGDGLVRLPYTGNETVLDALSQINGLSYVSSSRMWLARPNRESGTSLQIPIDWEAITQRADVGTNYQLLPGDRLYIAQNRLVAFDSAISKLTSPLERILGFTLLGTGTASRLSGKVLRNNNFGFAGPIN